MLIFLFSFSFSSPLVLHTLLVCCTPVAIFTCAGRVLRLFYSTQIAPPPISLRFLQKRHSDQSQSLDPATGPKIWHHLPRRFKQQHQQHRRRWGLSKPPARHGRQFHSQATWGPRPLARRSFRVFFSCPLGHASDRPPKEIHTFKLPPTQRRASSSRHPPRLRTTRAPSTASHWALARRFPIDSQLSHPADLLSAVCCPHSPAPHSSRRRAQDTTTFLVPEACSISTSAHPLSPPTHFILFHLSLYLVELL